MLKLNFYKNKVAGSESYGKVYARVENADPIGIDELAQYMSENTSSFSKGEISGMLKDAVRCIRQHLLMGQPVKLDDLAILKAAVSVKPADSVEKFDAGVNVRCVRLQARPTGLMARMALTKSAQLGLSSLAQRIKSGELTLSTTKGEYIEGAGSGEPTVNP